MKSAIVAPSHRLISTLPVGPSAVTTAPSPTSAKLLEAISATAPLQPSGTAPSECKHRPWPSMHNTPSTPSLRIAAAQVSEKDIGAAERSDVERA
eukprot:CAMPEP_0115867516 /NCGR_PEP_ID=MMETSP0287-20121206/20807_1 /TAXON_ID=412157 /ORGANISM="Chrysochromulina rotalis, Strain UIO044" /LENGTH=94 /DNA_ID=CAMNT_0003322121 /DNA_START=426 /DNA_END=706 /DNA_ORIENTATION=-